MRVALISIFEQFYTRTRTRTIYVCSAERLKLLCFFGRAFAEPYMKPLTRRVIFLSLSLCCDKSENGLYTAHRFVIIFAMLLAFWIRKCYSSCWCWFFFFLRWVSASFHISCKKIIKSNKKIHLKCLLSNWWVSFDECTFACSYSTCCTYIRVRAYERGWERVPD